MAGLRGYRSAQFLGDSWGRLTFKDLVKEQLPRHWAFIERRGFRHAHGKGRFAAFDPGSGGFHSTELGGGLVRRSGGWFRRRQLTPAATRLAELGDIRLSAGGPPSCPRNLRGHGDDVHVFPAAAAAPGPGGVGPDLRGWPVVEQLYAPGGVEERQPGRAGVAVEEDEEQPPPGQPAQVPVRPGERPADGRFGLLLALLCCSFRALLTWLKSPSAPPGAFPVIITKEEG